MPSKLKLLPKDIEERLKLLPERVASVEGLIALWLFGSFARGEATPISDVDLAYLPDERLQGDELERFETDLYILISDTLRTDEFTFVNIRKAPAFFAWKILVEGKLLFCRNYILVAKLQELTCRIAPDVFWLRHVGNEEFLEMWLGGKEMSKLPVDRDRIVSFLRLISNDIKDVEECSKVDLDTFLNSRSLQAIVERRLQTATESCINIGNHIISRLGLRAPQDYADVFRVLMEEKILSDDLAQQMMDMAKFRNLLVHIYWEIDHRRVYESLPQRIETLRKFAKRIAEWMKESQGEHR
jgi:Uncharacterized conserved protein